MRGVGVLISNHFRDIFMRSSYGLVGQVEAIYLGTTSLTGASFHDNHHVGEETSEEVMRRGVVKRGVDEGILTKDESSDVELKSLQCGSAGDRRTALVWGKNCRILVELPLLNCYKTPWSPSISVYHPSHHLFLIPHLLSTLHHVKRRTKECLPR